LIWFAVHEQEQYNASLPAGVDDVTNGITLRADVHGLLDNQVFVPASVSGQIVAYFLKNENQWACGYHNVRMNVSGQTSAHHLYSRFSFNIIRLSKELSNEALLKLVKKVSVPSYMVSSTASEGRKRKSSASSKPPSELSKPEGVSGRPHRNVMLITIIIEEGMNHCKVNDPSRQLWFQQAYPNREQPAAITIIHTDAQTAVQEEVEWSNDPDWHNLRLHPEDDKMNALKRQWRAAHPSISTMSNRYVRETKSDTDR
jgi:hypothetical protein